MRALTAAAVVAGALSFAASAARGESNAPALDLGPFVQTLLQDEGLAPDHVAMALYARDRGKYLYLWRPHDLMTAASNIKLVTSFAALRLLSPDFRWRTTFYLVEQHDGPAGQTRQGLYVRGSGDPSFSVVRLADVARHIHAEGVDRLDAGLFFDDSLFAPANPDAPGPENQPPISPYIVGDNAVEFTITRRGGGDDVSVITALPEDAVRVVSNLALTAGTAPRIFVKQDWSPAAVTFKLSGKLDPAQHTHWVSSAVRYPAEYYFLLLRSALRHAGVAGDMPLRPKAGDFEGARRLFIDQSEPLRALLEHVNKDSSNVAADALLRTIALTAKPEGVSAEDGVAVVRKVVKREFPLDWTELSLQDGAGLNPDSKASALFLVKLLNRIPSHPTFSHEYISSLSISGWDGTLRYRDFPERLRGRIRAKTGSLDGVQNISGYMQVFREQVVFSVLIGGVERSAERLQESQERILTSLYDYLLQSLAPEASSKVRLAGE